MTNEKEIYELKNFNVSTASEQEMRVLITHLQKQMDTTYIYWVGEWAGSRKARSIRTGEFVKNQEVIDYLNNVN